MKVGFISANLVAKACGFNGVHDWGMHDRKTREAFSVNESKDWIKQAADLGFEGVSMWTAHCFYQDVKPDDVAEIRHAAADLKMPIYSYAGGFALSGKAGDSNQTNRLNWEKTFSTAKNLGCGWLSGGYGPLENRAMIRELCRVHEMSFAFENHPKENSADDILKKVEGFEDCIGVALDTGWAGTCGFDAPDAIRKLKGRLKEVHLKDVREAGHHNTVTLGDGIVQIPQCVEALKEIGYDGWLSIEHEPYDRDPMPELETCLQRLRKWLA